MGNCQGGLPWAAKVYHSPTSIMRGGAVLWGQSPATSVTSTGTRRGCILYRLFAAHSAPVQKLRADERGSKTIATTSTLTFAHKTPLILTEGGVGPAQRHDGLQQADH